MEALQSPRRRHRIRCRRSHCRFRFRFRLRRCRAHAHPTRPVSERFRFGASSLVNDVLMQIRKQKTGVYQSPDYFTVD